MSDQGASELFARIDKYCKEVVRNEVRDITKRGERKLKLEVLKEDFEQYGLFSEDVENWHDAQSHQITIDGRLYLVRHRELHDALIKLPNNELNVIMMVFWDELRRQDIADHLRVSVRTVYDRKVRGIVRLRQWM